MYQKSRWYDVCLLIYGVWQTKLFVILGHFLPFYPTIDPPKSKFAKNVKNTWKYPFTHLYHKSRSYDAWFVRYEAQETVFFLSFWAVFWPWPYKQPKKSKFWKTVKKKKKILEILSFYTCATNDNHMMHGSQDIESNRQNFLSFWANFCPFFPFTTRTTWKVKILSKKSLFCHFGLFFALIPPNNQENQIFEKMKKMPWDIIILHTCTINENYKMYGSWDMQHDRQNFFSFWTIFSPFYPYNNPEIIIVFTPEEDLWKYLTAILDVCRSLGCTSIWWLYVTKSSNLDVSLDPRSSYVNDAMILFFKMAIIYTKLLTGLPT